MLIIINVLVRFLFKKAIKNFSAKILLDNNINEENIHSLKKSFSENVYYRKRITLEKTSSFSFLYYLFSSCFKFFDEVLSVLKYLIYMLFLSKPENMITKVQVYRKKVIQSP